MTHDARLSPSSSIAGQLVPDDPRTRVRYARAADDAFTRALFHQQRAADFAPLELGDGMLCTLLDQQYHAQRTDYAQRFPDAEAFVIEHEGVGAGRLVVTLQDLPGGMALHLVDITIAAAARGRGIGSDVIRSLARAARAAGATRFTLLVLHTNHAARRLYERLGFVAVAEGVHVLMERPLP